VRLLTFRLIISLIVGITLISLFSSYYEVRSQKRTLRRDLEHRAEVLGESLADKVEPYLKKGSRKDLQTIVGRFGDREHLAGVAVYNPQGGSIAITPALAQRLTGEPAAVQQAVANGQSAGQYIRLGDASVYIYAVPLHQDEVVVGELAIVNDASYINAQSRRVWRDTFLRVLVLVFLITLITLLIVRWSIAGPIARAAQWMHAMRTGKISISRHAAPDLDLFRPLAHEMANFAASLTAARSAAEKEAQLRQTADAFWTAERLSVHLRGKLGESRLFVVANREPYIHKTSRQERGGDRSGQWIGDGAGARLARL
jgi:uncharacterized membrane protein affecting hemolysin expression